MEPMMTLIAIYLIGGVIATTLTIPLRTKHKHIAVFNTISFAVLLVSVIIFIAIGMLSAANIIDISRTETTLQANGIPYTRLADDNYRLQAECDEIAVFRHTTHGMVLLDDGGNQTGVTVTKVDGSYRPGLNKLLCG